MWGGPGVRRTGLTTRALAAAEAVGPSALYIARNSELLSVVPKESTFRYAVPYNIAAFMGFAWDAVFIDGYDLMPKELERAILPSIVSDGRLVRIHSGRAPQ
jgi:hypothetical protein